MFRLSNEPRERGLSCTPDGVALAGIPLIRKTPTGFIPRPAGEIASLLKAAYGDRPMALPSRLDTIAKALDSGDFAMAMIAAVHTQTPELDAAAAMRLAQAEDRLAKYNYNPDEPRDGRGRWTAEGSDASIDPTALPTDDNREAGADNRPQRVAENTFPPRGSASSDAPVSSGDNISGAPADGEASHKPTTLQETFEQKYDGLKTEEFAKQVGQFGYWLEAHGRELSPAEKERALAGYSFLQDRLSSRIYAKTHLRERADTCSTPLSNYTKVQPIAAWCPSTICRHPCWPSAALPRPSTHLRPLAFGQRRGCLPKDWQPNPTNHRRTLQAALVERRLGSLGAKILRSRSSAAVRRKSAPASPSRKLSALSQCQRI
jgi:hypothetical protein